MFKVKHENSAYSYGFSNNSLENIEKNGAFSLIIPNRYILFVVEICILHLWIHALTFLLRIATHLRCNQLKYTETSDIKADCDKALKEIQQVCLTVYPVELINCPS